MDEPQLFPNQPKPEEHVKKNAAQEAAYNNISQSVTALGSRLRVLEEQYSSVRNKSQIVDVNLLEFEKESNRELRNLSDDVLEIKNMLQQIKEKVQIIDSELSNTVKEHDLKVIEKYVDLWNPTRFITREALKEKLEELKDD